MFVKELFICIKMDLSLNNLQWLMWQKNQPIPNQTNQKHTHTHTHIYIYIYIYMYIYVYQSNENVANIPIEIISTEFMKTL